MLDFMLSCSLKEGWTALHYACQEGRLDLVELLVNSGADVHVPEEVCVYIYVCTV